MSPDEYVRAFTEDLPPLAPHERALAASCLRAAMRDHVLEQLGSNPSFADSNVNAVWLTIMGRAAKTLEGS